MNGVSFRADKAVVSGFELNRRCSVRNKNMRGDEGE